MLGFSLSITTIWISTSKHIVIFKCRIETITCMLAPSKITEIFVQVEYSCKEFKAEIPNYQVDAGNYKARSAKPH